VRPIVGVACLLAAIAGVALYSAFGAERAVYHWDSMEKPPAVLQDRARELVASFGFEEPPADETRGYYGDGRALRWVAKLDSAETDWTRLRDKRPAAMQFWYRRGPEHLQSIGRTQMSTYDDPPMTLAGMIRLKLDTRGRLLDFEAVPVQYRKPDTAATDSTAADSLATGTAAASDTTAIPRTVDWNAIITAAGFDPAELREVESEWVPASHADERVAWRGTLPEDPEVEIRLEGAAYRGLPVSFRLIGDWSRAERMATGRGTRSDFAVEATLIGMLVAIMAAMVTMAFRNVRNGRGDLAGAKRLSLVVFFSMILIWVFRTNHASSPSTEINSFFDAVGQSLLACALFWTAYLALEPVVRSTWPGRIAGWSRLLTGRWNDPLVGRDILAGAVFFFVSILVGVLRGFLQDALGHGAPRPGSIDGAVFLGVAETVAALIQVAMNAIFNGLFFFLLLLLLRMICRKMSIAMVVYVLLFVASFWATRTGPEKIVAPYIGFVVGIVWLVVMLRFGMLAFIVGFFFRQLVYGFPMTVDSSAWYAGTSYFIAALVVGITAFGLRLALSARPSPGDLYDR
ncbi:hypothetical protein K8I85_19260, partial [bacterium]|nr:hypothetical protein [bacterium]